MSRSFRRAVLIDSSAVLALLDEDDANHKMALAIAKTLGEEHRPVFITNYIEAEAHALLLARLGRSSAREWIVRSGLEVIHASRDEEAFAKELLETHDDKDWSYCDALSFSVIDGRPAAGAFSFDHHFLQYGGFRVWGARR